MTTTTAMRHLRMAAIAVVFTSSALQAQPWEVAGHRGLPLGEASAPNWRAQWIWLPDNVDADMLLARKVLTLPDEPERAVLSITASSRYQVFINGKYLCDGPARCAPHHQSYDVLDVTDTLRQGKNTLAVRVHYQRETVSYYSPSRPGLLAQLDCTYDVHVVTVQTDASWQVHPDDRWQNDSPKMARFHLEVCDRMDLRRRIGRWAKPDFDASEWPEARVLRREAGWPLPQPNDRPTHLIPPWTSLVARDIPYLIETVSEPKWLVQISSLPVPDGEEDFRDDSWIELPPIKRIPVLRHHGPSIEGRSTADVADGSLHIAPNNQHECQVVVYDLEEVQNGRPFLDIEAPIGTVVDIMSAPYLLNESLRSPVVASTYVDRIVLSGQRERWEAFYMKPVRWLAVVFRHLPGKAELYQAGLMQSKYPFEPKGHFRTPNNPVLQTLWDAAAKTVQVCTTDAYTDNYRERRQYAQTAYYACLGNYAVFGDHDLQRRYLKQIAEEQLANGLMPAYAPRHGDDFMVILDSNCFWIRGLHQYLLYSGNKGATRQLLPAARKLLALLHCYTNSDGLIDNPPYPYWLDHALNDRRGANFCLNAHYLGALEDYAHVLQWLNEPDAAVYRERANRIRQTLRERLWAPQRQLFADAIVNGKRSHQFSEHANAMAMALKIATPAQMKAIASQLSADEGHDFIRRESGIVMVTPAMSYFLHAGLCEAGYADQSWDLLETRFSHMLKGQTNGTLWEEWWLDASGRSGVLKEIASGRSDAQTESAFFPGLFARYILGIEPTQPGLRDVVLRYYDSSRLLRRHGAIPTPSGLLEVTWDVSQTEFTITLATPPGTTVRIDLATLAMPSLDSITIEGELASPDQVEAGFLVIPAGDHTVRVSR